MDFPWSIKGTYDSESGETLEQRSYFSFLELCKAQIPQDFEPLGLWMLPISVL